MNELKIELSQRLEGVGEYYFSTKLREIDDLRGQGQDIINMGIGSPDRAPHPLVVAKLAESALCTTTHAYQPYKGVVELRTAFAGWYSSSYGVEINPESEVLPLMGSKEGIMHICMTYLNSGDRVLIPNPGYPTYASVVKIALGECVSYELNAEGGWFPNFEKLEAAGLDGVKMMIVNYPQMPTGAKPTWELFEQLVDFARRNNILLVHDNPYSFIRNQEPMSLLAVEGARDVVIELNSLSKSHNMAGWRIGAIFGAKCRIDEIIRFKSNMDSGMFLPLQQAAVAALGLDYEWNEQLNELYYSREVRAYELLDLLECSYLRGQAGLFVWAKLPCDFEGDCYAFTDKILYTCGVFITPGGIFGSEGDRYIRVSLCVTEVVFERAILRIKEKFR